MRSNDIERYKLSLRLTAGQHEVLVGILLGDATLETQNRGMTYRLKVEHGVSQKAYTEHLYDIFKDWVLTQPKIRQVTLSNGKTYEKMAFSTLSHGAFRFYAHQFYPCGKKAAPKLIERWLTPKAVAYWFMDDGSVKSKESKGVIFNTQGYRKEDVARLASVLKKKFNLEAKPRKQKEGYQIYISGKSYEIFKSLVSSYVLPEMKYKIPEARRTYLPKM